jgi:hypothetical protein
MAAAAVRVANESNCKWMAEVSIQHQASSLLAEQATHVVVVEELSPECVVSIRCSPLSEARACTHLLALANVARCPEANLVLLNSLAERRVLMHAEIGRAAV